MAKQQYMKVLVIPSFLILLIGRLVSAIGQIFFTMATMWYILSITNSALAAAIIPLVPYLTFALLGVPLATLSDRLNKKYVLIGTDIFRAIIILGIALLILTDLVAPWMIYIANLLIAIAGFLFNPAMQSLLPSILNNTKEELAPANALLNATSQTINLVGYAVGGIVIAFMDTSTVLFITCIILLLSAITIAFIRSPEIKAKAKAGIKGFITDSYEGITFLWNKKILRYCIVFGLILNFLGAPIHIFTPLYSKVVLDAGATGYGYLQSAFTAGAIIGALLSGKLSNKLSLAQWFVVSYTLSGLSLVSMAVFPSLYVAMGFSFLLMFGLSLTNVPLTTTILLATPAELRGRVMQSFGVLSSLLVPIGLLIGGWAIEVTSPITIYIIVGSMIVFMGIISYTIKGFKDQSELSPTKENAPSHS